MEKEGTVRVQKIIADAGIASRRKAEELIERGAVKVNGKRIKLGDKADPYKDKIVVADREIKLQKDREKYYIMLHKPRGFITTMNDEQGRRCVAELVDDVPARLFPVGRLDRDSEGLLLMTNDGAFANMISHPSTHFAKTYRVTVHPKINEDQLTQLTTGVIVDGRKSMPAAIHVVTNEKERTVLEIVLEEGRNRQIRKMCEAVGLEVARLKRSAIGPVKLGMLQPGKWRELTPQEMKKIRNYQKKLISKNEHEKARNESKNKRTSRNSPRKFR
ncbi:MAG: rRNA pseudouridine synthase [Clostridia bacterium]|nr:rRNA pseudouridine synthase [Clostridia bacterium]